MNGNSETFNPENQINQPDSHATLDSLRQELITFDLSTKEITIDEDNIQIAQNYLIEHQSIINRIRESNALSEEFATLIIINPSTPEFTNLENREKKRYKINEEGDLTVDKKLAIWKERLTAFYKRTLDSIQKQHALVIKQQKLKLKYQYAKYKELQQQLKTEKSSYTQALREYRRAKEESKDNKKTALQTSLENYLETEFQIKLQTRVIQNTRSNIKLYNSRSLSKLGEQPNEERTDVQLDHGTYVRAKMAYLTSTQENKSDNLTKWKTSRATYLEDRKSTLEGYNDKTDTVKLYNIRKKELELRTEIRTAKSNVGSITEVSANLPDTDLNNNLYLNTYSLLSDEEKLEAQTLQIIAHSIVNSSQNLEVSPQSPTVSESPETEIANETNNLKFGINIFGAFEFIPSSNEDEPNRLATRKLVGNKLINNSSTPSLRPGQKILFDFIHPPTSIPTRIEDGDDAYCHLYLRIRSIDGRNVSNQDLYVSTRFLDEVTRHQEQSALKTTAQENAENQREQAAEQARSIEEQQNATWFTDVNLANAKRLSPEAWARLTKSNSVNQKVVTSKTNQQKIQAWLDLMNKWHGSDWNNTQVLIPAKENINWDTRHEKVHYALAKLNVYIEDSNILKALGIAEDKVKLTENQIIIGNLTINLNRDKVAGANTIEGDNNTKITADEILITWDTPGIDNTTIHYKLVNGTWEKGEHNDDYSSNPVADIVQPTTTPSTP